MTRRPRRTAALAVLAVSATLLAGCSQSLPVAHPDGFREHVRRWTATLGRSSSAGTMEWMHGCVRSWNGPERKRHATVDPAEKLEKIAAHVRTEHERRANDREVYEHDYGYPAHDHLYCKQCRKLFEFESDELADLRNRVAQSHRFRVTGHRLTIYGVCETCSQAKRRVKRKVDLI